MSSRLIYCIGLSIVLIGCSSPFIKDDKNTPAIVEERHIDDRIDSDDEQATSYGSSYDDSQIDALNDPYAVDESISIYNSADDLLAERVIYFAYDSTQIDDEYQDLIQAHADYLLANPNELMTLEGHADERGSREYNLSLGDLRARSVKQLLLIFGILPEQIRLISYGEERPSIKGQGEEIWAKNRRVEIIY